jgi:predicted DNA-binding WGR domain protein
LFADPASGAFFGVSYGSDDDVREVHVWAYRGGGVWSHGPGFAVDGGFVLDGIRVAFDAKARRLLARADLRDGSASAGVFAAPLAEWLDSLPARGGAPAATKRAAPAASAPASSPERYLVYREAGLGKFWFAALAGKTWTATWGRRGGDGQSKQHAFPTDAKARSDFDKAVRKKLDEGYVDSDRGAAIAKLAQRPAYIIAATKTPSGADRIGGDPPTAPPACKRCRAPMAFIAMFAADAERLPLDRGKALALFMCETGKDCKTWDPDSGANAALILAKLPAASARGSGMRFVAAVEVDRDAEQIEDSESPGGSKLGGFATWVQDPQIPTCKKCKASMRFALQLDADDVGANFGDSGVGYAFTCPHGAKFLWQCA